MAREKLSLKDQMKLEAHMLKMKAKIEGKKAFWKRKQTEQESSISDHIGKLVDRLSLDDMLALGIGAWGAIHTESLEGFLTALLGYKLATTEGGTPPVSQIAGIGLLAFTGLMGIDPKEAKEIFKATGGLPVIPAVKWGL